jgi:hypothetical protein
MRTYSLALGMLALIFGLPASAHAAGSDISDMFVSVIDAFYPVWMTVAVLVTVIAGLTLMLSQDEGALTKARSTLAAVFFGGITLTIILGVGATNFVGIVYNGLSGYALPNRGDQLVTQATGVADWIATIAVVVGVLMVIIAATRAVLSFGDEGAYSNVRTALFHVILGIIIIASAYIFKTVFFDSHEPTELLRVFLGPLTVLLGIIGLLAVAVLVYAGFRMIISFGREDDFSAARSLAIRVVIGLVVLLISFSLIAIVTAPALWRQHRAYE